jgi:hypothetical protein
MNRIIRIGIVLSAVLAAAEAAPQARFVNATLSSQPAGSLASTFESLKAAARGPEWIGYAVRGVAGHESCCNDCWDRHGQRLSACRLEDEHGASFRSSEKASTAGKEPIRLEGSPERLILFRVERGAVGRVRLFDGGCALDAGGLPVHWLTDVKPAESLALLAGYVEPWEGHGGLSGGALMAIALHADVGADTLLERYTAAAKPLELRKQAAFWMGAARGRRGFEDLRRLALDPQPELREHVTFALTLPSEPEALDLIIRMAHDDTSAQVRGQALFWLSQKAGQRAVAAISHALEDDPETEVKTKAVFALSQLPHDQGIPLLIQQARTNHNPEVRKQAMFWLGQSGDPRALSLFEQILAR